MKSFVENNFNTVMLLGLLAGIFLPGLEKLPEYTAIVIISAVIFLSCSKVSADDIKTIDKKSALGFYLFRFVLFPIVAYYVAKLTIPDYAIGILLVSLMPAGVSSTAFANIMGGNPSFALSATVITNALAPLTIPLIVFLTVGQHIEIDILSLLITLCLSVFAPALLYYFVIRKITSAKSWVKKEAQFYSIILIGLMIAVVVALQKDMFFNAPGTVLLTVVVGCLLFLSFYVVAWFYPTKSTLRDRKTYAICSGANNIALSAGIAVLYFSPLTILFCVLGEIPWILTIALFEKLCAKEKTTP